MLSDGGANVRCSRATKYNLPLHEQVKKIMDGINKMQLLRKSQGRRVKKAVTRGDKAYLEGDESGYAGVFRQALASISEAHN